MSHLFAYTDMYDESSTFRFNCDVSNWDTSNVTNLSNMFVGAILFNQDLSSWDVSNVTDMTKIFAESINFDQDLSNWNMNGVIWCQNLFVGAISMNKFNKPPRLHDCESSSDN